MLAAKRTLKRLRGSNTTQMNNKKTSTTEAAVAKFQTGLVLTEARREEILRIEENATALQKVNSDCYKPLYLV
ncbi:hypothetical protein TL16_g02896 [Triparma laevis f. inornata]|uniref:Uncharacterized protein n=1 Tax=Triparma laevis f. inornata TaxID=1714386 RepID=A0A9W7DX61_9STRA|nr:hypothetical protein TL16_g02896 [Triparma laevis f. inornata]